MPNGDETIGPGPPDTTIQVTVTEMAGPKAPTDVPWPAIEDYIRETRQVLENDFGLSGWFAHFAASLLGAGGAVFVLMAHLVILLLKPFLPPLGGAIFAVLDDLRKTLDPQFALFSVAVINELLGTDFTLAHLPQGGDIGSHLARAEEIGLLFHRQLLTEFLQSTGISLDPSTSSFSEPSGPAGAGERITPISGVRAAARFSGLAINFGTATGIIATLGGLVPFAHVDEIREIGEEVARNLGLGRLQRLALAPLVQILLAEPYKWFINEVARPTQFSLGEVVNPFAGSVMPAELIWRDLARAGYSDDKIQAVLELHRKKLSDADISTLFRGGFWTADQAQDELKRLGYDQVGAATKLESDLYSYLHTYREELRAAAVQAYTEGHIDRSELEAVVRGLQLRAEEVTLVLTAADYKRKVPSKHLTFAEIQAAFELGIFDLNDFTKQLTDLGYSDDDQSVLLLLTLDKLQKIKAKEAAAAARQAAKDAKKSGAPPVSPIPPTLP